MRKVSAEMGPGISYSCIVTGHVLFAEITPRSFGCSCMNGLKKKRYETVAPPTRITNRRIARIDSFTSLSGRSEIDDGHQRVVDLREIFGRIRHATRSGAAHRRH